MHLRDSHFECDRFSFGLPFLSAVFISRNVFKLVFDYRTILVKNILKCNTILESWSERRFHVSATFLSGIFSNHKESINR